MVDNWNVEVFIGEDIVGGVVFDVVFGQGVVYVFDDVIMFVKFVQDCFSFGFDELL